jgi:NitT/TauT family transport system substrate-binding protein
MKKITPIQTITSLAFTFGLMLAVGCGSDSDSASNGDSAATKDIPTFSLAWSEYPSWSVFGVAHEVKLINGAEGKLGSIEKKWNVDIILREADYDSCITMYGAAQVDAACLTNMDALNPSLSRPSTMILPTSTSAGADACIVTDAIKDVKDLKGKKVYGLEKTVSEYCFVRNLELLGEKEADYKFSNMDPGAAAVAMQQKQETVEAIVVWNPFVMETLNKRPGSKVLFDSTTIPNEIIDAVIVSQDSLKKPGGKDFACAVIEAFYAVNQRIADEATRDDTLVALGEKFSHLDLEAMKTVVKQTKFFGTAAEGTAILTGSELPGVMAKVTEFCVSHEIVGSSPSIAFGAESSGDLTFDPSYIELSTKGK